MPGFRFLELPEISMPDFDMGEWDLPSPDLIPDWGGDSEESQEEPHKNLQKKGKLKDAIESYKKSLELNSGSANAHYNIGLAYVADKQYPLANEHAQKAYSMGMPFPALKTKLVAVGAWKVIEPTPTEAASPASDNAEGTKESAAKGVPEKSADGAK